MRARAGPADEAAEQDEASYEILGESAYEFSDEDGDRSRTASLASTDGYTPDEVASIPDSDGSDENAPASTTQPSPIFPIDLMPPLPHSPSTHGGDASVAVSSTDTGMSDSATFDIQETPSEEDPSRIHGCGIIKAFHAPELPVVLELYGLPEVRLSLCATFSDRPLSVNRPFHLLYVGEAPLWTREEISHKIASALTSPSDASWIDSGRDSQTTSRFSVVRVPSFSEGSPSRVQLVHSSGFDMIVNECIGAHTTPINAGRTSSIVVTLRHGTKLIFENGGIVKAQDGDADLPDLAVFCHNAALMVDSHEDVDQLQIVREALKTHEVPCLDISLARPYHNCPASFRHTSDSLRCCVEGRHSVDAPFHTVETLPLDIYSFFEMDDHQLNRHLAYITRLRGGDKSQVQRVDVAEQHVELDSTPMHKPSRPISMRVRDRLPEVCLVSSLRAGLASRKDCRRMWKKHQHHVFIVLFAACVAGCVFLIWSLTSVSMAAAGSQKMYPKTTQTSLASLPIAPTTRLRVYSKAGETKDLITSTPTGLPAGKAVKHSGRSARLPTDQEARGGLGFEVRSVDGAHFNIVPPAAFGKAKHPPRLFVLAFHGSTLVPAQVSRLPDGAYGVELKNGPFDHAVNITIWTTSSPLIKQSFFVNLGSSKSIMMYDSILRGIKEDVVAAQSAVVSIKKGLSSLCATESCSQQSEGSCQDDVGKRSKEDFLNAFMTATESLRTNGAYLAHQANMNVRVMHQSLSKYRALASKAARANAKEGLSKLWAQTTSVRRSETLLNARKNAVRTWQKLGGQSDERPGGQHRRQKTKAG